MDLMIMLWIWLAVIAIAALVEAFTLQMVSIWFVPGGIVALILYFCDVSYEWQIVACVLVSLVLLLALRRFCVKFILKNKEGERTNSDSLVGQIFLLKKAITDTSAGEVKVGDVVWTAVTETKENISANQKVEIVAIRGNKLIVKPYKIDNDTIATTKQDSLEEKQ